MLGALIGDAIGSTYERTKIIDEKLISPESNWTENSVLMLATADSLLYGDDYGECYKRWYHWYPKVKGGYRKSFTEWANSAVLKPYYSQRNDGAIRGIPIAYAFDNLKDVMAEAERVARVSHNHPEGIKGTQATAAAVFLAKAGGSKETIGELLPSICGYDLQIPYADLQRNYRYSELAQDTVPASLIAFLASTSYEDAIRKSLALGGDASTLTAITGGLAEAFYRHIPRSLRTWAFSLLDESQQELLGQFQSEFVSERQQAVAA